MVLCTPLQRPSASQTVTNSLMRLDQLRLMLCMYLNYPLGWFMKLFVRGTFPRHLYAIVMGMTMQVFMFRSEVYLIYLMMFVSYAIMYLFPRRNCGLVTMIFVLIFLSTQHIYRMVTRYMSYDLDTTTYTMVLTAKMSALAYCYSDGGKPDHMLLPQQKKQKVKDFPSVFELLSYTCFFSGCVVGPFFEYADYIRFIKMEGEYKHIPSTFLPSLKQFIFSHSNFFYCI